MEKESKSLVIAECAILVAMSVVLSFVKIIDMPYGGSVTAFSMLPVIIAAFRHGPYWGLLSGFTYSVIQLLLGLNNVSYATSALAAVAIIMLDYIVAYTCLGLVGFVKKNNRQTIALSVGTFLVCIIRFVCHIISGCTVWAGVSIPTGDGLIYSIVYNGAYMIPETVVTVAAAWMLSEALDFRGDKIGAVKKSEQKKFNGVPFIFIVLAVVVDFLFVFKSIQTEEGFDVTGISNVNVVAVIVVLVVGIVLCAVTSFVMNKKKS